MSGVEIFLLLLYSIHDLCHDEIFELDRLGKKLIFRKFFELAPQRFSKLSQLEKWVLDGGRFREIFDC